MAKDFAELATQLKGEWSADAQRNYEVVSAELVAERVARTELGAQLALARKENAMTQQELALASGVHQSEISRIESGVGNPTVDTILKLTSATGSRLSLERLAAEAR